MTTLTRPLGGGGIAERLRHALTGLDWILVAAVLVISTFGLLTVRAATRTDIPGRPDYYFSRSLVFLLLGVGLMVLAAVLPTWRLTQLPWAVWGALLGALAVVFVVGGSAKGSTRWIELGAFRFQPSELGKAALCLILAGLVAERAKEVGSRRLTLLLVGVTALPAIVVFVQPDLGTALVYGAILLAILFLAGVPWTHLATMLAVIVAASTLVLAVLPAAGIEVLKPYQVNRLLTFTGTVDDPGDAGYQQNQSEIAVGQGGALGKGPGGATQTNNDFLPEHHTDFIFAVVAEMFGFVGAGGLILAYGLVLWRGMGLVARASSQADQLVAGGIVAMLAFQVFVNIGMTVGIMPITGIPLPFMSYGGSHTLSNLIAVGLLLGIHRRRATI
ncbi:MAG: rod shape-determining protein RodA [Actinomycetota bacterium]